MSYASSVPAVTQSITVARPLALTVNSYSSSMPGSLDIEVELE
jgi:hypothetical protein